MALQQQPLKEGGAQPRSTAVAKGRMSASLQTVAPLFPKQQGTQRSSESPFFAEIGKKLVGTY